MRFKKLLGFYADTEDERHSVYATDTNEIHNRYGETEPTAAAAARRDGLRSRGPSRRTPLEASTSSTARFSTARPG